MKLLERLVRPIARRKIKTQGRILMVIGAIPIIVVPAVVAALNERKQLREASMSRARLLADALATAALEPLLNYDTPALDDAVEAIRQAPDRYEDLYEAMILDADGRIVAYARPSNRKGRSHYADYGQKPSETFALAAIESDAPELIERTRDRLDVSRSVFVGGKRFGTVLVRLDLTQLHAAVAKNLARNMAVAVVLSIAAAAVIAQLFRALFLTPVDRLVEAAEALGRRDFGYRIRHERDDEIGEVFDSVNRAAVLLQEREKLHSTFGRYVTNEVRDAILSGAVTSRGKTARAAVLFADLRGFTSRSEGRPAEEVLGLLNRYCSRMTTAIHAHGGIVDKFIGDSVMAVFGVPFADPDCATKAVMAIEAMRTQLDELNTELAASGDEPLRMGIGLHVGECVAGCVGPPTRQQYTVVGDTVNLASRLQGMTKKFGVDVILSEQIVQACGEWLMVRDLGDTTVDGREGHVHAYQLVGTKHDRRQSNDAIEREKLRERDSAG